ncbi:MAG: UDP-N-acetylmuramoyl-tripeptide--D-alanyl-D-alanine ligase [Eubacteriales bacterium]|nr:UDP-N-acetylmuramoyl-tripeptide--D-alanyl-D-alanine ligase [Eubacteriales bacterium]
MEHLTLADAVAACDGKPTGDLPMDTPLCDVCIDSRAASPGSLFVPIAGDRFDGHDFIAQALAAGAISALTSRDTAAPRPLIRVRDTAAAFQAIAGAYRSLFSIPFVGITGSVGKTTTKELIYCVLSQQYNTLKNEGNLNNQTGVPLTLLRLTNAHEVAIVEMGTNHFGEIDALAKIVRPDVCVFTNIGDAHIQHLGSREGILQAKCEMLPYRSPDAPIIVNGEDPLLRALKDSYDNVLTYGTDSACDVYASDIVELGLEGTRFIAHFGDERLPVTVPAPGSYMVLRALCALCVGLALDVEPAKIAAGIEGYTPMSGRMAIVKTPRYTLINDAYNANPTSVAASIDVATASKGRSVLILGDMFELGKDELKYHREIGEYAVRRKADRILCVGTLSKAMYEGAEQAGGNAAYFTDKEALLRALPAILQKGDTVLIKASNGMKLQDVAQYIEENL